MKTVYLAIAFLFAVSESSCNKCISCEGGGFEISACSRENKELYDRLSEEGAYDDAGKAMTCTEK